MKNPKRSPLEHFFLLPGLNTWLKIYKDFCIAKIWMYLGCLLKTVIWDVRSALERKKKINISHYKIYFRTCEFLVKHNRRVNEKYLQLDKLHKYVYFFVKDFQQVKLTITRLYRNRRLYFVHPEQNHLTFIHRKQVILFISRTQIGKFLS